MSGRWSFLDSTDVKRPKLGSNATDIQQQNRALLVRLVRQYSGCSRAQLAKMSGLTQATVTKIVADLLAMDILQESGRQSAQRGRRATSLQVRSDRFLVLGIKLARTSFAAGVFDISGQLYEQIQGPLDPGHGPDRALQSIQKAAQKLKSLYPVRAVGVALPGPYFRRAGKIGLMTGFPGWEKVDLHAAFARMFALPVFLEHDAKAGALAEWYFGGHKPDEVLLYFLAGEGIGAGIISQQGVFVGSQGIAGEIGHMSIDYDGRPCSCGSRGCLERYCSSLALVADVQKELCRGAASCLKDVQPLTPQAVFGAAAQGDMLAQQAVDTAADYMGYGLANLVSAYDPGRIIIGQTMALGGQRLLSRVRAVLQQRLLPQVYTYLKVELSALPDAILSGAAATATDQILKDPAAFAGS